MKPSFMCVGAAKAGTTWLHVCLSAHPEIYVPNRKEIHFFSYPYLYKQGIGWYESFFQDAGTATAVGDISGSYLSFPDVPERIHAYNPDTRLLFILRDPVKRAYSHYCMDLRGGAVNPDITVGLSLDSPYLKWGRYFEHISRFLDYFSLEQMKVVFFDDMKNQPASLLQEVYDFLGVDSTFVPPDFEKPRNSAKALPKFPKLYNSLRRGYQGLIRRSEPMRWLLESLRIYGAYDLFHRLNKGAALPQLSPEQSRALADYYRDDVQSLSTLLNRDLSAWLESY